MKKIVITLFVITFISKAEAVELVSSWTDIPPNIDGYILDDEWKGASLYQDTFLYHNLHENRDEEHPFTLRLSNDEKQLYIGIRVFERDKPQRNKIIFLEVYFKNNDYLDVKGFERFKYYEGKLFRGGEFQENLKIKGVAKSRILDDFRFYEIKVPISASQVLKFAIYYCEMFNPIGVLSGGEWEKSGGDLFPHEADIKRFKNFAILKTSKKNLEFPKEVGKNEGSNANKADENLRGHSLKLYGFITTPDGKPIKSVSVQTYGLKAEATTDWNGYYETEIEDLMPSNYSISVIPQKIGYLFSPKEAAFSFEVQKSDVSKKIDFIASRNVKIDEFEPDDDMENAKEVEIGKLYHHSLSQDDTDWSFFVSKPGYFYIISTSNLSEYTDTMLQVWKNGKLIDGDDDSGFSLWASKVEFISKTENFYFVKVEDFNGRAGFYSLSVNSFNLFREIPLPAPLRNRKENTTPKDTVLLPNYPNPFNAETWIPYRLAESSEVEIKIYSVRGELIRNLKVGEKETGDYITKGKAAYWDGRNELGGKVASGIYFYTLETGSSLKKRKLAIIK